MKDAAWCLSVLRAAAPTVEELYLVHPLPQHLAAVHTCLALRRLDVWATDRSLDAPPTVVLPALPQPSRLTWLRVGGLPRATTESLLGAHWTSLDVLWLYLGTDRAAEWPGGCDAGELGAVLRHCGPRLSRLVLGRPVRHEDGDEAVCLAQVATARRVLPGCTVQCAKCDRVYIEQF